MSFPDCQMPVVAFLCNLTQSQPIETHISGVFVGAEDAWKLKKAVHLPYLDFTSEISRHKFLRRELELNRPDAPEIYRDILAIERNSDGALVLAAEGDCKSPLDWVLRMAPVPADAFLENVASGGGLTSTLLDALADCVVQSHLTRPPQWDWDSAGALRRSAEDSATAGAEAGLPTEQIALWHRAFADVLDSDADWLAARARSGFVRRCHGDLHMGNLCLWQGKPTPFDALEFDETLATIDVGYDFAFLLMDLDQRVCRGAANRVMNRYMARNGDTALAHGLPIFLSLRAMIRAHISAQSGNFAAGLNYLAAACEYLIPAAPKVIAFGGLPASGKSTVARLVAPGFGRPPGAVILRSDEVRKQLYGVAPEQRLPVSAYDDATNKRVGRKMADHVKEVAAGGQSVVVDATFLGADQRSAVAQAAREGGAPFIGIWLMVPYHVLEARIGHRTGDVSDAGIDVLHSALAKYPWAKESGPVDWLTLDGSEANGAAQQVMQLMNGHQL